MSKFKVGDKVNLEADNVVYTGVVVFVSLAQAQYKVEYTSIYHNIIQTWFSEHELQLHKETEPIFTMTLSEGKALYDTLEFQYIHQDREEAHKLVNRIQVFLKENGLLA